MVSGKRSTFTPENLKTHPVFQAFLAFRPMFNTEAKTRGKLLNGACQVSLTPGHTPPAWPRLGVTKERIRQLEAHRQAQLREAATAGSRADAPWGSCQPAGNAANAAETASHGPFFPAPQLKPAREMVHCYVFPLLPFAGAGVPPSLFNPDQSPSNSPLSRAGGASGNATLYSDSSSYNQSLQI